MPEQFEIDFGVGDGFITVNSRSVYTLKLEKEGDFNIQVRYNQSENSNPKANTSVQKTAVITTLPNMILGLVASNVWPGQSGPARAIAWIKLGKNNNTNQICNPLIFVEGIDFPLHRGVNIFGVCPNYIPGSTGIISLSDYNSFFSNACGQNNLRNGEAGWNEMVAYNSEYKSLEKLPVLRQRLENEDYDVIYLDFYDGAGLIQNNAMVLVELLEWVNANRGTSCNNENIVMGASMGGQVARFALSWMEQNNLCHNTNLYVSFDSPHKGANVALGLQHMINNLAAFASGAVGGRRNLERPASMQMLLFHFNSNATTLRNQWQAWQNTPNSYPQDLRKIAVTNGSIDGQTQSFGPGARLIETNAWGTIWARNMRCFALNGQTMYGYNNVIFRNGNSLVKGAITETASPNWPHYDSGPGSIGYFAQAIEDANGGLFHTRINYNTFMPSVSSLDVFDAYGSTDLSANVNLTYNIKNNIDKDIPQPDKYPFDAFFAPDENEPHVQITDGTQSQFAGFPWFQQSYLSDNIGWIMQQLNDLRVIHPAANLSSFYNFGTYYNHKLKSVTIENGGQLYVNKNGAVSGTVTAIQSKPGTFKLATAAHCPQYVQVNTGGRFVLGDETDNAYRAEVTFKNGSTLNLNGGKLVINDNSRLIIEAGATLIINPNTVIELNGDNAVLDIRGDVNVSAGATFTFTTAAGYNTGYIRYSRPSYKKINVTSTSSIVLRGDGITDKILEIAPYSNFNYSDWGLAALTVEEGRVEMGKDSKFYIVGNANVDKVHFDGASYYDRYQAVELHTPGNRVRNCKFSEGEYGLATFLFLGTSDIITLTNNEFGFCKYGLRSWYGNIILNDCEFIGNNEDGWKMDGGGAGEVNGTMFNSNKNGINYISSGGTLNLTQSTFYANSSNGAKFEGSGTLSGSCTEFTLNTNGIEASSYAYLDLSDNSYMQLYNFDDNIVFTDGGGLNFQNGQNRFICEDNSGFYYVNSDPKKTAGIRGSLVPEVYEPSIGANYPYHNPSRVYSSNYNLWNNSQLAPVSKTSVSSYDRFDYHIYSIGGTGPHAPLPAYTLTDNNPLDPLSLPICNTGGGGSIAATDYSNSTKITSNSLRTTAGNVASQIQGLEKAIKDAKALRKKRNTSGNDMQAFNALYAAMDSVQPDTTRQLNELVVKGYRLMRDIYSDALLTDSSNSAQAKLNKVSNITNKVLSMFVAPNDSLNIFYAHMNNVADSYAAGDLVKARVSLSKATNNIVSNNNSNYALYWNCLINVTQQLQDSTITLMDAFVQLDACTVDNTTEVRKIEKTDQSEFKAAALQLYPNPTSSNVTIEYELTQDDAVTIELLDIQGRVIKTYLKNTDKFGGIHEITVDVSNQLNGLYLIRVYGNKFNQTARLVVVK